MDINIKAATIDKVALKKYDTGEGVYYLFFAGKDGDDDVVYNLHSEDGKLINDSENVFYSIPGLNDVKIFLGSADANYN